MFVYRKFKVIYCFFYEFFCGFSVGYGYESGSNEESILRVVGLSYKFKRGSTWSVRLVMLVSFIVMFFLGLDNGMYWDVWSFIDWVLVFFKYRG